ncbi:MATE family efflux transporter [Persicitalea jodogahamensis]|uniref:Multidrug-efflux transporter n=1 Tax=Persicitalea jodogahamensis TaxID=402147 RepID=A0A8J3D6Q1_9BACT|nr:MATE family efflux transporter [Persicitalea jodogahamensis]GHB68572.1 MATE family efflux transporter [Persicitalea jodogahamensis]
MKEWFKLLKLSLNGSRQSYVSGSIDRAIFLLAVPMVLEMGMESLFAVVDIFFASLLSTEAVVTVGLTATVVMLVDAMAIGLGVAASALVARRIGEGEPRQAGMVVGQVILIALVFSAALVVAGWHYAGDLLRLMGAEERVIAVGTRFAQIEFLSSPVIVLMYALCGSLRGAGAASAAMRSLWIANGINILLDPLFIFGLGPFPEMGITGAAVASAIGWTSGVGYQLYFLYASQRKISVQWSDLIPDRTYLSRLLNLAVGGTGQLLIASASWIFLTRIVAGFGSEVVAGYTIAIRIFIFTLLPSWGMANAAATLVGQNLGAQQPGRAAVSVWRTARCNMWFLLVIAVVLFFQAETVIGWFSSNAAVLNTGVSALRIFCLGYGFYGYGIVIIQSINGAGDTQTPLYLNLICFWLAEIPLAYLLGQQYGAIGVFASIPIGESLLAILSILVFRSGEWKMSQV